MKFNNTKSKTASIKPVYKEKWNKVEAGNYTGVSLYLFWGIYIQVKKLVIISQNINYFWSGICSKHKNSG